MVTNLKENNWLYQSNKFIEASFFLTTNEQKILRILASFINKEDVELKEYNFNISDLAEAMGINEKNAYRDLENISDKLMSRFIKIKDQNNPKNWESFHIIKKAKCYKGIFTLKIDNEMKDFYLNLKEYTKYRLKNILEFKGKYTFRIYELLIQHKNISGKNKGIWERVIKIDKIREMLELTKKYKDYCDFKKRVILYSQEEINKKTDISFEFEEIKTRSKVTAIRFIVTSKNEEVKNLISTEKIDEFILKFNNLYNSNLAGTKQTKDFVQDLINYKGLEHFESCLQNFPKVFGAEVKKGTIRSLEGLFMNFAKNGYNFNTSMMGEVGIKPNFDQREYTEEDFEKYYYKVSE